MHPNNLKLKIRPTVLVIVSSLIALCVITTLTLQYFFSKDLANKAKNSTVTQVSKTISKEISKINSQMNLITSIFDNTYVLKEFPKDIINRKIVDKFTAIMEEENYIYSLYVGYGDDSFYEMINLNIDKKLKKKYKTSSKERWLLIRINKQNNKEDIEENYFLDKNLNIIRVEKNKTNYSATYRPWYKKAIISSKVAVTEPYMFKNLEAMGITYSKSLYGTKNSSKAVLGIDISLESLSKLLQENKTYEDSELYLLSENKILASNFILEKISPDKISQLQKILTSEKNILEFSQNEYFVSKVKIHNAHNKNNFLVVLIPYDILMKPYMEKIYYSIIVNIIVLLLFIPIIYYTVSFMSRSITDLTDENLKVKRREFDKVRLINSPIKEVYELSLSFVDMAKSIKKYQISQQEMIDSFIQLIAGAIDEKSKYTGGHCKNVPILTNMLVEEASKSNEEPFKNFKLNSEDEKRELNIAGLLHDCGKVTTPEYIIDKATKLETIYNRIHEVRMRFEVIHRDLIIESYEKILVGETKEEVSNWLKQEHQKLQEEFEFIAKTNIGGEFMEEKDKQKVEQIAQRVWKRNFDNTLGLSHDEESRLPKDNPRERKLLENREDHIIKRSFEVTNEYKKLGFKVDIPENLYNQGEIYNLQIDRGTLTAEDRFKINEHIMVTIKMLEKLPLPENLKKVPEYAGSHHETLIGTGYPRKLTKEQMSIPARIMAIADVFEALTASDRPYKKPKKLSEAIKILSFMVKDEHLDKDLFKLFLKGNIHIKYAQKYLKKEQLDDVDISQYLDLNT